MASTINGRHPKPQGCKRKLRPSTLAAKRRRDETGNEVKSAEYEEYSDCDDEDLVVFLNEVSSLVDLCIPGGESKRDHHPKSNVFHR
jgi:hypothetical protein